MKCSLGGCPVEPESETGPPYRVSVVGVHRVQQRLRIGLELVGDDQQPYGSSERFRVGSRKRLVLLRHPLASTFVAEKARSRSRGAALPHLA